jgi:DNA-binding NtrC family response regulator
LTVLITLHDVEPAVRLNAQLEREGVGGGGIKTEMVSPLDDMRGTIKRVRPDVIVFTGDLSDPLTLSIVRDQLWAGVPVVGLAEPQGLPGEEQGAHPTPWTHDKLRTAGYTDLFVKPVQATEVAATVKRILERRRLQRETGLIGESEALREVFVKLEQMAPVSSTVLIEGESGTGKELVARALHRLSARKNKPFIAVNVGALPETLLESELFGHEKGAFTGAAERRIGRFELADTGTLFLDEIGDIPQSTQVKLLRALEEREFMRLGGVTPIRVDVRVIAATNRPLREHVEEGSFRADLFYRLNVLSINLPPLRERPLDVPYIARKFIAELSAQHDRKFHGISAEAMQLLVDYPWPGNVRELRNLVESMVVLSPGREIRPEDLPRHIREGGSARWLPVPVTPLARATAAATADGRELEFILRSLLELRLQVEELRRRFQDDGSGNRIEPSGFIGEVWTPDAAKPVHRPARVAALSAPDSAPPPNVVTIEPGMKMADIERLAIQAALKETRGNRRRASEMLGIGERTLYRKIKEYKLPEHEYAQA